MSTTYRPTCSIFVEVTHSGIINGNEPHNCGEDFWIARTRGEFFPQAYFDRLTLDDAYRIQIALIDRRVAAGERCESEEPKRGSGDCVDDPAVDPQGGACRCGCLRRRGVDRHVGGRPPNLIGAGSSPAPSAISRSVVSWPRLARAPTAGHSVAHVNY